MRTSSIGRIMEKVGGMLRGSGRGSGRGTGTARRGTRGRTSSPRRRGSSPAGGTGGLGRLAKKFLR